MAIVRSLPRQIAGATLVAALASGGLAAAARAADIYLDEPPPGVIEEIVLDVGIGPRIQPKFFGASSYEVVPNPIFELQYLRLPYLGEMITSDRKIIAFTFYPAFEIIGERKPDDAAFLAGLDPIDTAVELGPGARFRYGAFEVFAEGRFGVTGHDGAVVEGGFNYIMTPGERWEVSLGPRFEAATNDFMETYFGVTPAEAANPLSVLPAYDPGGGFMDVGAEGRVSYDITRRVRVHAEGRYSRFVGDAAASPIIEAGDINQFEVAIGLTYRFGLDFSD